MKKRILGLFVLPLVACGCATTQTGPTPAGQDMYVISRQAGAFPSGREPLLQEALIAAEEKCKSEAKKMTRISSSENEGPYVLGNYPRATVTFRCS
jgi:hypothetical protein